MKRSIIVEHEGREIVVDVEGDEMELELLGMCEGLNQQELSFDAQLVLWNTREFYEKVVKAFNF